MNIYDIEAISQQNPITKDCKTPPNKLTNIAAGIVHVFTLPKYDKITNDYIKKLIECNELKK